MSTYLIFYISILILNVENCPFCQGITTGINIFDFHNRFVCF